MEKRFWSKMVIPFVATLAFGCQGNRQAQETSAQLPNIIYILADDLGYGDLSCLGQQNYQTPNIDRLAAKGMLFTQHYAGSTVCAPSRCSLMTGLHTGHTLVRGNKEVEPEGQWPIPDSAYTLAEMLKKAGYITGAFGKWGLGFPGSEGDPNLQGFDQFFGYNCQRKAHNYYPEYLWDNQKKLFLEGNTGDHFVDYAPEIIHRKALDFIDSNKDEPFFLFYPNVIPHAELIAPEENMSLFRNKFNPELSYKGVDSGPGFRDGSYCSQPESHTAFVAMVDILDKQVGEIVSKLKELGLEENTIIMFTSDNGPHKEGGADPDYFDSNGPLRGYKRDLYEGGIRVPMIVSWPGIIAPGSKTDHISAFWDVMPTLAEIAGCNALGGLDGISFLPVLTGQDGQKQHKSLYWEFHELGGRQAVRMGDWKLVCYNVLREEEKTIELYNLKTDVGEKLNVAGFNPEIVQKMIVMLQKSRTDSELFQFEQQ
ncbi:arylsulfatase [uncultured Draconibacterium sp.]|uniref:arylsulfatase n=1 Tax=uncultured Draconibacterium sp. TaxID=1573823 RepID=UPI0029C71E6E|nr:arylsulfatase [uncultured Draconibacterium sp.]